MTTSSCPLCHADVEVGDLQCNSCGVDLALVTALTESILRHTGEHLETELQVAPEILVPRLGEHLVEEGVLSEEDLAAALMFQKERNAAGKPILLGQALIHLGLIDAPTLDRAITRQIYHLQDALQRTNRDLEARVQERTKELQDALKHLGELSELKANFIANISHELRTPLAHIKGYTEMFADRSLGPLSDEQAEAVSVMERSLRRLESLINDLIRFSDTSQGEISLRLQPFSIHHLVRRAAAQASARSDTSKIDLVIDLPEDLPDVLGDLEKISWVIFHLLDNAVKFTPTGGKVQVSAVVVDGRVRISVSDTGIGIPEDRLEEIFEPFHQLDSSSTRRFGGTGLGLALVRHILRAHSTDIDVQSRVGQGSTFSFHLPVTRERHVAGR